MLFFSSFLMLSTVRFCWHSKEKCVIAKVTQVIIIRNYFSFNICKTLMEYSNLILMIQISLKMFYITSKKKWHHLAPLWQVCDTHVTKEILTWEKCRICFTKVLADEPCKMKTQRSMYGKVWLDSLLYLWKKWIMVENYDLKDMSCVMVIIQKSLSLASFFRLLVPLTFRLSQ